MSLLCTQFNPFGSQDKPLKALKAKMEEIVKKIDENSPEGHALTAEALSLSKIVEELSHISERIPVHSIQSMMSEIAVPLSKLLEYFGDSNKEEANSVEINNMFDRIGLFIELITGNVVEPFNSEMLCCWGDIFKALLTSKNYSLKRNGAALWKKTFGTIKTPMNWPGDLRETLNRQKRLGINLPPVAKASCDVHLLFTDDKALDGLTSPSEDAILVPKGDCNKTAADTHSTLQLSQQSTVNAMADKLLKDQKIKSEEALLSKINTKQTPNRKRTGRIFVDDEDSCDYVKIASTPPSNRKNKLTDRQKDTIAKAAAPKTSINYVDEESQSGMQKSEDMKNAYRALNFEIGEESMTALMPEKVEKKSSQVEKKEKSIKRNLFDSPVKALPVVSSSVRNLDIVQKNRTEPVTAARYPAMTSPPKKRGKTDQTMETVVKCSNPKEEMEKSKIVDAGSNIKSGGRSFSIKYPERSDSLGPAITDCSNMNSSSVEFSESKTCSEAEVPKELENSFASVAPMHDADSPEMTKSPPKTPRTPSILRAAKRNGGSDSPLTEKKRNRVHFGEDSLPNVNSSSPITPRRKVEPKSLFKPESSIVNLESRSNSLLDISPEADSKIPFFPALINCPDPIDKILFRLVRMCTQKSREYGKKQLQIDGVTTIGDFASLPKSQIDKYIWIKSRTSGASNTLTDYEKTWNCNKRVVENVDEESAEKVSLDKPEEEPTSMPVTEVPVTESPHDDDKTRTNAEEFDTAGTISTFNKVQNMIESVPHNEETSRKPVEASDAIMSNLTFSTIASVVSTTTSAKSAEPATRSDLFFFESSPCETVENKIDRMQKEHSLKEIHSVESFLDDARNLRCVCNSLLNNDQHWPAEKTPKLLKKIKQSSRYLKSLMRQHGHGEWKQNDDDVEDLALSTEEGIEKVCELSSRIAKNTSMNSTLPWLNVMNYINDSCMSLDTIYSEKM